ncbi:MAG TPA: UbiX family flavin prenyltransferase [Candidatus Acidoferrales bacterium]|nr:UbiX family flavin prenyltransferase [Candidatus Acidoferrales bacterium]
MTDEIRQVIVAMSGASGSIYGVRLIKALKNANVTVHLTISPSAEINLELETGLTAKKLSKLVDHMYPANDMTAPISSGSFSVHGMVIAPCSMKTLAAIANGYSDSLTTRAADVTLKEERTLVLVPRETPLNQIHLRNMLTAAQAGAIILPASPGFYHSPKTIDELIDHIVGKIMDILHIEHNLYRRWSGLP